jgi:hypothetical protein
VSIQHKDSDAEQVLCDEGGSLIEGDAVAGIEDHNETKAIRHKEEVNSSSVTPFLKLAGGPQVAPITPINLEAISGSASVNPLSEGYAASA